MDAKGRVKLPKGLLGQLNTSSAFPMVVNRGYEKHLMLYPNDVWLEKTKEINKLNMNRSKERQAIKYFYRGAQRLTLDNAERILIPKTLIDYAGLEKDLVLFAYGSQIEIWDAAAYENLIENEPENFSEILDSLYKEQSDSAGNE